MELNYQLKKIYYLDQKSIMKSTELINIVKELNKDQKYIIFGTISFMPLWYIIIQVVGKDFVKIYSVEVPILLSYCLSVVTFFFLFAFTSFMTFTYFFKKEKDINKADEIKLPRHMLYTLTIILSWISLGLYFGLRYKYETSLSKFIEIYFLCILIILGAIQIFISNWNWRKSDSVGRRVTKEQ